MQLYSRFESVIDRRDVVTLILQQLLIITNRLATAYEQSLVQLT